MIAVKRYIPPVGSKYIEVEEALTLSTASIVDIDTQIAKMKEYVDGYNWEGITYYKQIKGEDDVITPLDAESNNVAQQYDEILNYTMKITSPITTSGDIVGTGVILHFRPQVNDVFKAPLITGDMGLFAVTDTVIKNFNNSDVVEIEFKLTSRERNDPATFRDLKSKVVKTLHFDKSSNYQNSSPLLLEQEWSYNEWLKQKNVILKKYYIGKFKDARTGMLITDGYTSISVIELFIKLCDARDNDVINIVLPASNDVVIDPILNAILNKDTLLLYVKPDCFNAHPNPIYRTLVYDNLNLKGAGLFGENFRNGYPRSDVEVLIYNYINNTSIDKNVLKDVVETLTTLDDSIIYMVTPILILIIQDALMTNSSDLRRLR